MRLMFHLIFISSLLFSAGSVPGFGKPNRAPIHLPQPIPGVSYDAVLVDWGTLKKWGYRKNKRKYYHARMCTPKRNRPQRIAIQTILGGHGVPTTGYSFCSWCRFSIVEETYRNRIFAQARFRAMLEKRHVRQNSRLRKECGLRGFFQLSNRVYILHTDVMIHVPYLERLLRRVELYFLTRELRRCNRKHPQKISEWECKKLRQHFSEVLKS